MKDKKDKIKAALHGDQDAAAELTKAGVAIPCPFCGGKAKIREHEDGSGGILCSKCDFIPLKRAYFSNFNKSKEDALAEWNQRVRLEEIGDEH